MYRVILSAVAAMPLVAVQGWFCGTAQASTGLASYYGGGDGFDGSATANGERFNANALTAASLTLPFGTLARVTYHGHSVVVRINDRGPYAGGRVIDLSAAAARAIGLTAAGVGAVDIEVVGSAGGSGLGHHMSAAQADQPAHKTVHRSYQVAGTSGVKAYKVASLKVKHRVNVASLAVGAYAFQH